MLYRTILRAVAVSAVALSAAGAQQLTANKKMAAPAPAVALKADTTAAAKHSRRHRKAKKSVLKTAKRDSVATAPARKP